jgi:MobA/MobL family
MSLFHMAAKIISRGKGQSAIAAAAYRSGERLRDEQAGEQKFYTTRAERILFTDIMAPKDAPEWAHDRNRLWNEAEGAEKRKDAQLAREFEVALPHEFTDKQREWLVKDFTREAFVRQGYVADIAIHAPDATSDERNYHAHIMVTMRTLGEDGFAAKKDRSLNTSEQLDAWREQWANLVNRHLERHGHDARVDHRSLEAQGIDREPTVHLGYAANEMAQRGARSDRMDALQAVMARNDIRLEMKAIDREVRELEASAGRDESRVMDGAAGAVGAVAEGVARVADGVANFAAKGIEFLADFFGGASAPPPPTREQVQAEPPPAPEPPPPYAGFVAPSKPQQTIEEFVEQERQEWQQQKKELEARALAAGRPTMTQAELDMQDEAKDKTRDRGGGRSL